MDPEQQVTRVVVADDHPPQRLGIRAALEQGGFAVVAEAGDTDGAVEAALRERPDVVVLDIHMPGGGGITAAERITAALPATAVVMLTVSQEDEDLFAGLRAGAAGYLLKDTSPQRLPLALKGVLAGEAALPRTLVSRVLEEFSGRAKRRLFIRRHRSVELTDREWQVLEQMRAGRTTAEIAEAMFVSPVTVRSHVRGILKKLDVKDRSEALKLLDQ